MLNRSFKVRVSTPLKKQTHDKIEFCQITEVKSLYKEHLGGWKGGVSGSSSSWAKCVWGKQVSAMFDNQWSPVLPFCIF